MPVVHTEKETDEDCLIGIQMLISLSCTFSIHWLISNRAQSSVFGSIYTTAMIVNSWNRMRRHSGSCRNKHVPMKLKRFIYLHNVLLLTMCNMLSIAQIIPRIITILSISGKQMLLLEDPVPAGL